MKLSSLRSLRSPAQASRPLISQGASSARRTTRQRQMLANVTEKDAEVAAADSIEAGLGQITKQLLMSDPETLENLRRYEAAVIRLEKAKAASEELERMFAEASRGAAASDKQAEEDERQRANEKLADAEVEAAERLLRAAELEYAAARRDQQQWASAVADGPERIESAKAAAVAAAAGLLAVLPLQVLSPAGDGSATALLSSTLSLLSAAAACFLFGVTYRYAVRSDVSNKQLRLGVVAAFGLVRASGAADILQATAAAGGGADGSGPLSLAVVGPAALYAFESMLLFGFASLALEVAFGSKFIKRFGEA